VVAGVTGSFTKRVSRQTISCALLTLACASGGGLAFDMLGMPAPYLGGAILTTGLLFVSGVVSGQLPGPLIAAAFIVIGASIGARFSGIDRAYLASSLSAGLAGVVLAVGLTAAVALPAAMLAGAPFIQIWLAIAPGGFDTMIALSLALGVDPAFVAGHQLLRLAGLFFIVPFLFRDAAKSQREDRVADTAQQDDCE